MPYKTRLRKEGVNERPFAHAVKLCWFILKFQDTRHKYTLEKFCKDFEKILKTQGILEILSDEYGIEWTYFNDDGSFCTPKYSTVTSTWIRNNEWREQYPRFKADRLMSTEDTEREKYIRYMAKLNQNDFNLLDRCYDKEKEYTAIEENGDKDMTYYRNKNNDTISNIDDRLRKRNGFDKTKLELDGKLKADVETETTTKVNVNEDVLKVLSDAISRRNNQSDS